MDMMRTLKVTLRRIVRPMCGLLLLLVAPAMAADQVALETASEALSYRISYRGVFTGYAWKDLADMQFRAYPAREKFEGAPVCRATMTVDTREYGFSEFAYPVRLRYDALAAPDLSFTRLVSDHDDGVESIHNVMWFDWDKQRIKLYRKRLYLPVISETAKMNPAFSFEPKDVYRWEADGKEALPGFLSHYPPVGEGLSYLIHKKTQRRVSAGPAMDPLTMLYALRTYDYHTLPEREIAVVHKAKIGHYLVRPLGRETIHLNGQEHSALHVRVKQHSAREGEAGQLDVWLSEDSQRLILRFDIEAPVGLIRVDLVGQSGAPMLGGCVDASPLKWARRD